MIIIEVAGGLGNQLQQYALYRKFLSLGKDARLDVSWFEAENQGKMLAGRELELQFFDGLSYSVCTPEEKAALVGGAGLIGKLKRKLFPSAIHCFHESQMYHPELLGYEHMYLKGYFACEKYYRDILPELRDEIRFPVSNNSRNKQIALEMRNCESVSVHIRRGDYLNPENERMFGNICTDAYYSKALELLKEEVPGAHFYLFSDDVLYIREKYHGNEYTVVDINRGRDSFFDMWLMSNCRHNICANSTFSFWGARLNHNEKKIIIRPTIHKSTQVFDRGEMRELWQGWRFISPEGEEC